MCATTLDLQQTVQGGVASARKCRAATSKVTATSREMQCLRESLPCGRDLLCRCKQLLRSSGCLSRVLGQSKQVNGGGGPNPGLQKYCFSAVQFAFSLHYMGDGSDTLFNQAELHIATGRIRQPSTLNVNCCYFLQRPCHDSHDPISIVHKLMTIMTYKAPSQCHG